MAELTPGDPPHCEGGSEDGMTTGNGSGSAMDRGDDPYCVYCGDALDAGSEFVYLVEEMIYGEANALLEVLQHLPGYHGEPWRICKECLASIEENRQDLLKRAAEEKARAKRLGKVLAIVVGAIFVLYFLALIIDDLRR
jgi:hypothetical protein